jgi:tetratricopeptide (TPR) repeat protein
MIRRLAVASLLMQLCCWCAVGQTPPSTEPSATQPAAVKSPQEVLATIEQWLETAQTVARAGRLAEVQPLLVETRRALEAFLSSDPRNTQARVLFGEFLALTGDANKGREYFKAVLDVESGNFRANLGLGRFYVYSRMWRQATLYLQKAEAAAPQDRRSEVLRLLAVCFNGLKNSAEAVAAAQRAVAADPEDLDTLQLLVQVRVEAKQIDQAVEAAKAFVAVATKKYAAEPSDASLLQGLVRAVETQIEVLKRYHNTLYREDARGRQTDQLLPGKEAEAAQVLSQIAARSEELAKLRWELSYHESLMMMEKAVEYQPKNTRYVLDLAGVLEATYKTERAIQMYQRILEITDPTDADLAEARQNKETAKTALERLNAPLTSQPATESAPAR